LSSKTILLSKLKFPVYILVIGVIFLSSCSPTKYLNPEETLLHKVKVKRNNRSVSKEEIINITKQKPNKKILSLFRFHLGVYNYWPWPKSDFRENTGEPPVVYDSLLTKKSVKQISLFLKNKGYFNNNVTYVKKEKNRKTKIIYQIETGEPYLISKLEYNYKDDKIKSIVDNDKSNSLIKIDEPFDIDVLDNERKRLRNLLKNEGYYYFNKGFIKYKVDSTVGNKNVTVILNVLNNKTTDENNKDSIVHIPHEKYYINDINILLYKRDSIPTDTIKYKGVNILYNKKLKFRPKMIKHAIGLSTNNLYLLEDHQATYKYLTELKLFKNIGISYEDVGSNKLNSTIRLVPLPIKSFAIEAISTNTGGDLGVEGGFVYQNKNLFRGGELLEMKLKGGLEIQQLLNGQSNKDYGIIGELPFNTFEFGPEVSIKFPRFLLPISMDKFSRRATPKTEIKTLFNVLQRPEYYRTLAKFSFGYNWFESKNKKHTITPFDINVIKLDITDDFLKKINLENNPFILNSYTDHFITATTYSFVFNNQKINKISNFIYLRSNIEFAGNILSTIDNLSGAIKNAENNSYSIFGVRYAQYTKTDVDFRHYTNRRSTSFVKRVALGIGVPYGNLNVLPFEKSYYGGGANGIRAWTARKLGPGSYVDDLRINQIGEIKIETNLEYRFDITKLYEAAFFIDAGNVWIINEDEKRPNAEINISRFWQDIAIGTGVGLRLDFSFFIIRFDLAFKLKDPSLEKPEMIKLNWEEPNFNLGIGYPF